MKREKRMGPFRRVLFKDNAESEANLTKWMATCPPLPHPVKTIEIRSVENCIFYTKLSRKLFLQLGQYFYQKMRNFG